MKGNLFVKFQQRALLVRGGRKHEDLHDFLYQCLARMSLDGNNPLPECLAGLDAQGKGEEEVDAVIRCGRKAFYIQ